MAQIPVLKLTGLFIKTAAKPVAAYFKAEAPKSPVFSKICAAIGQSVHKLSSRLNVLVSGYKFVGVKPLEHDVALSKGVEYVAEFIVIGASGGIIMIEFSRSEKKNAIKAAKQAAKEAKMQKDMKERLAGIEGRLRCIEYILERETEGKLSQHMKMNLRLEIDNILDSPENSIGNSEDIDACSLDSRIGRVPVIHNMRIEFESPAKEGAICDNSSNMKKSNSKPPCLTHDVRSSTSTSTSNITGIEFPSPPDNNDAGNIADHSYMSTYVLDYISYCHSWLYDYWSDKPKP